MRGRGDAETVVLDADFGLSDDLFFSLAIDLVSPRLPVSPSPCLVYSP